MKKYESDIGGRIRTLLNKPGTYARFQIDFPHIVQVCKDHGLVYRVNMRGGSVRDHNHNTVGILDYKERKWLREVAMEWQMFRELIEVEQNENFTSQNED